MCRWFAYISPTEHCLLEDVLITPAHALSKQCNDRYLPWLLPWDTEGMKTESEIEIQAVKARNWYFNDDGLGVTWYNHVRANYGEANGPRPVLYRTIANPATEPGFASICANTSSLTVFGHIRAASPGSRVTSNNCHPFVFGRHTFMHNGGVDHFTYIPFKRAMIQAIDDDALANIWGTTDSEHMAALFFTHLSKLSKESGGPSGASSWDITHPLPTLKLAAENMIRQILDLQKQFIPAGEIEPSGLNIAVTDGVKLVAIRFRNSPNEQPSSLYLSTVAGVTLNRKYPGHPNGPHSKHRAHISINLLKAEHEHGTHVIVASEPTTYKPEDWELIEKNTCILVDEKGGVTKDPVDVQF